MKVAVGCRGPAAVKGEKAARNAEADEQRVL
jgi:hypothetical protein